MTILCHKQQLVFVNHGTFVPASGKAGTDDYVAGHYENGGGNSVAVTPKADFQIVPDWVRNTETFKRASKAGIIVEVNLVPPPSDEAESKEVKAKAQDDSPAPVKVKPEPVTGLSGNAPKVTTKIGA